MAANAAREGPVETETVGRVVVEAKIESLRDLYEVQSGAKTPDQARSVIVMDALVDTGATMLSLPTSIIRQLGLNRYSTRRVNRSVGLAAAGLYDAVQLTIQGRNCMVDAIEVPDGVPVLIGQIPLEHLDFVVDLRNRTLIGNPAHQGEHMYDLY